MKKSLLYLSLLLFCCSCSSYQAVNNTTQFPIIELSEEAQKFTLQLDFFSKHFDGILVANKKQDEIRVAYTTMFGLSLFNLGIKPDSLICYNAIEPLKKKGVVNYFENSFRTLFTATKFKKVKEKKGKRKYIVSRGFFPQSVVVSMEESEISEIIVKRRMAPKLTLQPIQE